MSLKSFSLSSLLLVLIALPAGAPARAEDQDTGFKNPRWRKASRQTYNDWEEAKAKYEDGMANYYYYGHVYDLYTWKVNDLKTRETQINAELARKKPEGLNSATETAWNRHMNNLKLELSKVQAERVTHETTLKSAEKVFKSNNPEALRKQLDQAAQNALVNVEGNLGKKTRKIRKIENETLPDGKVAPVELNQITLEAARRAREEFTLRYPDEPVPGSRRELAVVSTPSPTPAKVDMTVVTHHTSGNPVVNGGNLEVNRGALNLPTGDKEKEKEKETVVIAGNGSGSASVPVVEKTEEKVETQEKTLPQQPDCDLAYAEIVKLLLSKDHHPKAFADMIHLAQLKLAYRMTEPKQPVKTLEAYVKDQKLGTAVNDSLNNKESEFSKSLTTIYSKFGVSEEVEKIKSFEKSPGYIKTRLDNRSASALLLYLSKNEKDPVLPIQESDAAAVWAMSRLAENKKAGSADFNLLTFSTRLCQYFKDSSCGGGSKTLASLDQIKADHETKEKEFSEKLSKAAEKWARDPAYKICFEKDYCKPEEPVVLGMKDLEKIKTKLAEVVHKKTLDGISGKIEIDPARTVSKGGDLTLYLKEK